MDQFQKAQAAIDYMLERADLFKGSHGNVISALHLIMGDLQASRSIYYACRKYMPGRVEYTPHSSPIPTVVQPAYITQVPTATSFEGRPRDPIKLDNLCVIRYVSPEALPLVHQLWGLAMQNLRGGIVSHTFPENEGLALANKLSVARAAVAKEMKEGLGAENLRYIATVRSGPTDEQVLYHWVQLEGVPVTGPRSIYSLQDGWHGGIHTLRVTTPPGPTVGNCEGLFQSSTSPASQKLLEVIKEVREIAGRQED